MKMAAIYAKSEGDWSRLTRQEIVCFDLLDLRSGNNRALVRRVNAQSVKG
jgi:hypothetical protein